MCRKVCAALQVSAVQEIKLDGNLNLFDFISQFLRCHGVDRGKSGYLKASDLCLVNTT
jgi:hypothetical protein